MEPDRSHPDAKDDNAQDGVTTTMNPLTHHGVAMLPWHIPNMSDKNGNFFPTMEQGNTDKTEPDRSKISACR